MKATIDDEGYLKIEVGSIIESMSEADLRAFAKYAVFQQHLLRGVVDALSTVACGATTRNRRGGSAATPSTSCG